MKRMRLLNILALVMILVPAADGFACTTVMAAKNGMVLAGHNEDFNNPRTQINFLPAADGRFGCFYVSWENGWVLGGMNDQGLLIHDNGVTGTGWRADPAKPDFPGNPRLHILQTCATIADVRRFFETNNVPNLYEMRFPVVDRSGASMVVEYAQGSVRFITENTWYQLSTNFLRTEYPGAEVPCNRFRLARQIFDPAKELSVPLIRSILSATHQEGRFPTLFSCIYDLKAGLIYVYHFHNFEEVAVFNLAEELKKEPQSIALPGLFTVQPHAVKQFLDRQLKPVRVEPSKLNRLTGWYKNGEQIRIISSDRVQLFSSKNIGDDKYTLIPLSETEFGYEVSDMRLHFEITGDKVIGVYRRLAANAHEEPLQKRMEPIEDKDPKVTALVRQILRKTVDGTLKPDLFTPDCARVIFPDRVSEIAIRLKSLGSQADIELYEREGQCGIRRYLYRLSYEDQHVIFHLWLKKDNRISKMDFFLE
jgi:hypothetical protein